MWSRKYTADLLGCYAFVVTSRKIVVSLSSGSRSAKHFESLRTVLPEDEGITILRNFEKSLLTYMVEYFTICGLPACVMSPQPLCKLPAYYTKLHNSLGSQV